MPDLPELGVGLVYFPALENLIESHFDLIQAIEIEPQTLWFSQSSECDSFKLSAARNERLKCFPCPKIFHGVGYPVGGSILPSEAHFSTLNEHIQIINPLWISEHLSFNAFMASDATRLDINFLLPPLQTRQGVETAVAAIKNYRSQVDLPFLFETGTNYLGARRGDLADGEFIARVAEESGSYILLDLHNILANQKNGRQLVTDFIKQLPLEKIIEIHLAGGFVHDGYYLDAHSGISSTELFEISSDLVKKLPNLKALIFEMLPEYAERVSAADLRRQLEQMNQIWETRGCFSRKAASGRKIIDQNEAVAGCSVQEWEFTLGSLALSRSVPESDLADELSKDEGLPVIRKLIFHSRASMIVSSLQLTTRLLQLTLDKKTFEQNLIQFCRKYPPRLFAYLVAEQYAEFLGKQNYQIRFLGEILEFEIASLKTTLDKKIRTVKFDFNPFPVFRDLSDFKLPIEQEIKMCFELEITPDELIGESEMAAFPSIHLN